MSLLLIHPLPPVSAIPQAASWRFWETYAARFVDPQGRVIDFDADSRTTSEGQAYALFFALAAGDRERFDRILDWTENNLARGDLSQNLPGWLWGKDPGSGQWKLLDSNSASDADLWMAFSLIEAGRLWNHPPYHLLGIAIARNIEAEEVVSLPGFGPVLLPGPAGFRLTDQGYQLNPSYLAPQVLRRIATELPLGPWEAMLAQTPEIWRSVRTQGLVFDWITWSMGKGFAPRAAAGTEPKASYDAIRVYLWAGMLDPSFPDRSSFLDATEGMASYLRTQATPPLEVNAQGDIKKGGGVGFSAAVAPLLSSLGEVQALATQRRRIAQEFDAATGLYGHPPRYYDQCLLLFSNGWGEGRFRFGPDGEVIVRWTN